MRPPVRDDRWQPTDELMDSILTKSIAETYRSAPGGGGSPVLAAGAMVLGVFGVVLATGTGSPLLAVAVVVALAVAGLAYVALRSEPETTDRSQVLAVIGGAGNLPAGYLVHPAAWEAGMREYLAGVPEGDLRIAANLCRQYPGSVTDLLRLVARADRYAHAHAAGQQVGEIEVFKAARRLTYEVMRNAPTMALPAR